MFGVASWGDAMFDQLSAIIDVGRRREILKIEVKKQPWYPEMPNHKVGSMFSKFCESTFPPLISTTVSGRA